MSTFITVIHILTAVFLVGFVLLQSGKGAEISASFARHVVLPLVMPGIAASAIFTFVLSWNEVFAATILTIQNRTLPAQVLVTLNQSSEPYQFAGGFFLMIPALIFIFYIRRYLFNMWGQVSK